MIPSDVDVGGSHWRQPLGAGGACNDPSRLIPSDVDADAPVGTGDARNGAIPSEVASTNWRGGACGRIPADTSQR